ncbi:ATP-binding protein [Sporosarcina sp. A2]|uniref:PAS domain-containing sensor histidine kinase n=1 Tax=Sporosarcina sp. A2 TaxID=3393449 RepID=UPI003D7986F3
MKKEIEKLSKNAHIHTNDNFIYRVSEGFLQLTGYEDCDLIGKSLMDLGILLKSEHQIAIQDIKNVSYFYIFNSTNLPLEVKVSSDVLGNEEDKVYFFEKMEDAALQFTLDHFGNTETNKNGSVAIFSYPDCVLLKHDDNYIHTLSLMDIISDNLIGKHPSFSNNILDLMNQGISFHEFEVESKDCNGIATYWDINLKMISGNRNKKYLVTSFYDVTDRVREKKFIEKQKSEMELVVENMSDVVIVIDKDGKYTYINKVGRQALSQYIPKYISDIKSVTSEMAYGAFEMSDTHGERLKFENISDQRVLRGEKLTNHTIIGSSELPTTYFVCDGTPIYDEYGNTDGGILIYKNIENSYKVEEYKALQENVEGISSYYASFSHIDFKINYINEYAFQNIIEELPHINSELDIIGKSFFNIYRTEDVEELIKDINKSIECHSSYLHKHEFIRNGKTEYTKTIFQPIFNENNEVEKIIALGIDISDEEIAYKAMEKLLKAQEEIFINTSHEFKTPLSVIFGGAQLLNLYLDGDSLEDSRNDIININEMTIRNCYRLTKLINNILDISKIESGVYELNLANYNIVDVVDDIVHSVLEYTKSKGINIIFDTDIDELYMAVDLYKFERILLNLISNAIKFSTAGEVIVIKLVQIGNNTVGISVTDEGIGIEQKNLEVIFNKFIQLNRNLNRISEGTGIGLPLAKSMAELHGGSISVESTLDKGSTFTIELPVKTIDGQNEDNSFNKIIDRVDVVKYEFSDIYL